MEDLEDSRALARAMVDIGNGAGRKTAALISDMSQPLGAAVGNSLEVIEAVEILQGKYEGDLLTVALALGANMLCLGGIAADCEQAEDMLRRALRTGRGLQKLGEIIVAQGGDARITQDVSLMPRAAYIETVTAEQAGVLAQVDCKGLGMAAGNLGAGRLTKDDVIDLSVGFIVKKRLGDNVEIGDVLFEVHSNDFSKLEEAKNALKSCITIADSAKKPVLICDILV